MEYLLIASDRWHPDDVQPNVVVPFANDASDPVIFKAMTLNLTMQGLAPRYERMNGTIDEAYSYMRLLVRLWEEGKPFILVEHDVLPWPGAVQALWQCPEPWCAYQYLTLGEYRAHLGCTKFDPARLGPVPLPRRTLVSWQQLDVVVIRVLSLRGHAGHLHYPAVAHLNYGHQRVTKPDTLQPEPVA